MAFLLNRSGKQMVRLSSSTKWAPKSTQPLRLCLTNSCFSTDSSSPGGMKQEFTSKDEDALKNLLYSCSAYFAKNMANAVHNKPLPPSEDFQKFLGDLFEKLPYDETEDPADQAEENPNEVSTAETIKAASIFADTVTGGLLNFMPKPVYMVRGDNFNCTQDTNGFHVTVNVCGLAKEHLLAWVSKNRVLVASKLDAAPNQKVREAILLPDNLSYDSDQVTGTIIEGGHLKITFPVSKEVGKNEEEKYFDVNLV